MRDKTRIRPIRQSKDRIATLTIQNNILTKLDIKTDLITRLIQTIISRDIRNARNNTINDNIRRKCQIVQTRRNPNLCIIARDVMDTAGILNQSQTVQIRRLITTLNSVAERQRRCATATRVMRNLTITQSQNRIRTRIRMDRADRHRLIKLNINVNVLARRIRRSR